jgi:hypothetical protein
MAKFNKGGLIGGFDTIRFDTPSFSGVWDLREHGQAVKADTWENPLGDVGFWAGGEDASGYSATIDRIQIATTGNAIDFGDLSTTGDGPSTSSTTRALVLSGNNVSPYNHIQYYNMSNVGTQGDFGDITTARLNSGSAMGNGTRGVFGAGQTTSGQSNVIDYVTIASTGNALDFGDLTVARNQGAGGSNSTRGIFSGGQGAGGFQGKVNTIDYITIASAGNATDFGDLSAARTARPGDVTTSTRLVIGGGYETANVNKMEYVTIGSTGNMTDFGDLTVIKRGNGGVSNATRGVFGGGSGDTTHLNIIDYITIGSTGNATDFGDLQGGKKVCVGATSIAHGGLQ